MRIIGFGVVHAVSVFAGLLAFPVRGEAPPQKEAPKEVTLFFRPLQRRRSKSETS
jgi:hypothetical protein